MTGIEDWHWLDISNHVNNKFIAISTMCHQPSYRRWNSINLKHAILTFTSANERKGERTRLYATIRLYMRVSIYCQALILNGLSPTVVLHRALCSWPIINVGGFYLCRSFLSLFLPFPSLDTNICESSKLS